MDNSILMLTEQFVKEQLGTDSTGHDWYHVDRVRKMALTIANEEGKGNLFIIELAALLHDIPDVKLNDSAKVGQQKLQKFLDQLDITEDDKHTIIHIIETVSFRGGIRTKLTSIEAEIVQDADRIDAIGAIGVARAFAYGGKKGQPIYNPSFEVRENMTEMDYRNGESSSIHHFYEKLLLLKERLNTEAAKEIAKERHEFMEYFLNQFYKEWNGHE